MKKKKFILFAIIVITSNGCSSGIYVNLHPNWTLLSPERVAIVGFFPLERAQFLANVDEQLAVRPENWWDDNNNKIFSEVLTKDYPEYQIISYQEVCNVLEQEGRMQLLDTIHDQINEITKRPPGYRMSIERTLAFSQSISEICAILDTDAVFLGVEKIEPLSYSSGGLLVKFLRYQLQLLTVAYVYDRLGQELWSSSQRFITATGKETRVEIFGDAYDPVLLTKINASVLTRKSIDFFSRVFPHRNMRDNMSMDKPPSMPLFILSKGSLVIFFSDKSTIEIRNQNSEIVYESSIPEKRHEWVFSANNGKIFDERYTCNMIIGGRQLTVEVKIPARPLTPG